MNTLDDLRSTLHGHAHDLDGLDPVIRSAGIHARITEQRRRRNAVRGGVALAAVAAVISGVVLTDLGQDPAPDPAAGLGAPESFTALGWTYALVDAVESDGPTQTISLPASERPYLISWKTAGAGQDVTVTSKVASDTNPDEDNSIWSSSAADWTDHVVVNASQAEEVTVSATPGETIAVATYEIDPDEMPAGKGSGKADGFHFRDRVADRVLVDAAIAEGGSEVSFDYAVPSGRLTLTHACSGVPKGAWVRISLDGSEDANTFREGCDSHDFDPGAGSNFSIDVDDRGWSKQGKVRMWVSRSEKDPTPVAASKLTGVTLGAGIYSSESSGPEALGMQVDNRLERSGHAWQLTDTVDITSGIPVPVDSFPAADGYEGPWLVELVHNATSDEGIAFQVQVDGEAAGPSYMSGGKGTASAGDYLLPLAAETVGVEVTEGDDSLGGLTLLLYRLAD